LQQGGFQYAIGDWGGFFLARSGLEVEKGEIYVSLNMRLEPWG